MERRPREVQWKFRLTVLSRPSRHWSCERSLRFSLRRSIQLTPPTLLNSIAPTYCYAGLSSAPRHHLFEELFRSRRRRFLYRGCERILRANPEVTRLRD